MIGLRRLKRRWRRPPPERKLKARALRPQVPKKGPFNDAPPTPEITFHLFSDVEVQSFPDPEWLIEGVLQKGGFAQLYGREGTGKTFLALDWAFCVATGTDWGDLFKVAQGPVAYVFGEGRSGIKKRVSAWKSRYGIDPDEPAGQGVFFLPEPVQLLDEHQVTAFTQAVLAQLPTNPSLIIFDTLARCAVGGDENSAKDMGVVVHAASRIKEITGASVLVIHHSGYDDDHGRGSSAMPGALDLIMHLKDKGRLEPRLTCMKQKDYDPFEVISLKLVNVGDSLTVTVVDAGGEESARPRLLESDKKALGVLIELGPMRHKEWLEASGLSKATFNRVLERLLIAQMIGCWDKQYYPLEAAFLALGLSPTEVSGKSHEMGSDVVPEVSYAYRHETVGLPSETEGSDL